MLKLFLVISSLLLLSSVQLIAQAKHELKASLSLSKVEKDSIEESKPEIKDDILVKYHFDRLANAPTGMQQNFGSMGLSVAFFSVQNVKKSGVSFAEGIGFSSRNYKNNVGNWQTDSVTENGIKRSPFYLIPDSLYKSNKIVLTTVDIPLEIRFAFKSKRSDNVFKLATGITLSYVIGLSRKTQNDAGYIVKEKKAADLKNIESFRYAYNARMSYNKFGVLFSYDLLPLFNKSNSQVTPFAFGIVYLP